MTFKQTDAGRHDAGFDHELSSDMDCTVRATAIAAQLPYGAAHRTLALAGRIPGRPISYGAVIQHYAGRIANYAITPNYLWRNGSSITLAAFLRQNSRGRFVLRIGISRKIHHVFAVIDGIVHDTSIISGRCRVLCAWEFRAL